MSFKNSLSGKYQHTGNTGEEKNKPGLILEMLPIV